MSNRTFNTLRFIQSIVTSLATCISILSERWGFAYGVELGFALAAINTVFGVVLDELRKLYNKRKAV